MAGRTIPQPQYPDDDGGADPRLRAALDGYAAGRLGEHPVLEALQGARLLVPVVAVLNAAEPAGPAGPGGPRREKDSDMALPTLVGANGRRGVPAFTSAEALARWRADARPVAVPARQACRAVLDEAADALVLDVAGPAPFAVDGLRLHLLAEGRPVPPPHQDPDVLAAIEAAFGTEGAVTGVRVGRGASAELAIRFGLSVEGTGDAAARQERAVVQRVSDRLAETLRGRIVGGVELSVVRR